jgi:hypothetical protein
MKNGTITTSGGRTVGFADYGTPDQTAVLWCHGGPGNRMEPSFVSDAAARAFDATTGPHHRWVGLRCDCGPRSSGH